MLVLTRKTGESIRIGDDIVVTVVEVRGNKARIGIVAPKSVAIVRPEADERRIEQWPEYAKSLVGDDREFVKTYTTAPEAYDGFGTRTIETIGTFDGKEVRVIETPEEHVQWQRSRNESGMYFAVDEATFKRSFEWNIEKAASYPPDDMPYGC